MYEAHTRTLTLTRTREWAVRGHVKKNGRRPSWKERDARHGKLGRTMYEAHARTRTLTRTRERAVRGHVKKRPPAVMEETARAPWKTGQNHVRGTSTYTDPYTDP